MKTCVNCGAEISDNCKFCPECGTKCPGGEDHESTVYASSGQPTDHQSGAGPSANAYPMKWHNFLMVIMILGGIMTIINGAIAMTGSAYLGNGYDSSVVYSVFPGLKSCDMFYGVALIALGVFEFTVRSRLKRFCANGPGSLRIMYILFIAVGVIYLAWASSATGIRLFDSSNTGSLVASVSLLVINHVYYSKRSELFVN